MNFLCSIQLLGLICLVSIILTGNDQKILAAIGISIFGITRCIVIIPFILLLTEFNKQTDSTEIGIWVAAGIAGNAFGFFYTQLLNSLIQAQWYFIVLSFSILYCLLNGLLLILIKQTNMNRFSNMDLSERIYEIGGSIGFHIRKYSHKMIIMEPMIVKTYSPVYLSNEGLTSFGLLIPTAFSLSLPLGPILVNRLSGVFGIGYKVWINLFIILQALSFASLLFFFSFLLLNLLKYYWIEKERNEEQNYSMKEDN